MRTPTTLLAQVLEFAAAHGQALVTDGVLCVRYGPNGLQIVDADEPAGEGEQKIALNVHVIIPKGLDILRPVVPAVRENNGWRLEVRFNIYKVKCYKCLPNIS